MIRRRPRSTTLPTAAVAAFATLGLAACGGDDGGTTTVVQAPAETVTVQQQPAATAEATPATTEDASTSTSSSSDSTSRSEAVAIARKRYPGERRIGNVRSDDDDGRREWEVRQRTAAGAERTVTIDRASGRILDNDVDRDDNDDRNDRDDNDD